MLRNILKWTLFSILFLIAGVALATTFRQHRCTLSNNQSRKR